MAINKKKNVLLQITMPKEDYEHLCTLEKAFNDNGIKTTKSHILVRALRDYINILVSLHGDNKQNEKAEEPQEDKENA